MHIISPTSNLTNDQQAIFAQGASYLLTDNKHQIGVWTHHTPIYKNKPVVAIGACSLSGSSSTEFLQDCVNHIQNEHSGRMIVGPMNGNTWMKHRLILETSQRVTFRMEPMEPASMLETFEKAGFKVLSRYSSSLINLNNQQPNFEKLTTLAERKGIIIRSIDMDRFEQDLNSIYDLSTMAFADNFLYTPLPREVFMHAYLSAKSLVDPDLVMLAFKDQRLIGFVFCLPDEKPKSLIVKTLATCPKERTAGLGTLLVARAQRAAKEKGYTEAIHALQYESNSSLRISQRFDAKKFRTYGLMSIS